MISFIFAQNINAPSAQQLCLEDSAKLFQLLSVNPCAWRTQKEGEAWPYDCRAVLQCTVPDSLNTQYSICPGEIAGLSETQWSTESAKTLFDTDKSNCNSQETHLQRCHYSPERVDGTPVGNVNEAYCRIPLKPRTPAQR
ncbi:hypothetical protein K2X05_14900 [bacterium]|nr:hypothetical protein [bacterium]